MVIIALWVSSTQWQRWQPLPPIPSWVGSRRRERGKGKGKGLERRECVRKSGRRASEGETEQEGEKKGEGENIGGESWLQVLYQLLGNTAQSVCHKYMYKKG